PHPPLHSFPTRRSSDLTFKPTIIGFGAVLDNLSGFLDDTSRPIVIVGAAAVYIVLWLFVAGGIIDRYARDRATRAHGFFSASGRSEEHTSELQSRSDLV